jgi:hypothetical protein
MFNLYEVILVNDQPTTCPKCDTRTEIVLSLDHTIEKTQFHKCNFEGGKFEFGAEEDLDIENQP